MLYLLSIIEDDPFIEDDYISYDENTTSSNSNQVMLLLQIGTWHQFPNFMNRPNQEILIPDWLITSPVT